jgi:hypothetical protein
VAGQRSPVTAIAHLVAADEDTVRDVIHAFTERGLSALDLSRMPAPSIASVSIRQWRATSTAGAGSTALFFEPANLCGHRTS